MKQYRRKYRISKQRNQLPVAFIFINVTHGKENVVLKELQTINEISEAYFVYGIYDIVAEITNNLHQTMETLRSREGALKHLRSTLTLMTRKGIVKKVKQRKLVNPQQRRALMLHTSVKDYLRLTYKNAIIFDSEAKIKHFLLEQFQASQQDLRKIKCADFLVQLTNGHFIVAEASTGKDIEYKIHQLQSTTSFFPSHLVDHLELHIVGPELGEQYWVSSKKLFRWDDAETRFLPVTIRNLAVEVKSHPLDNQ